MRVLIPLLIIVLLAAAACAPGSVQGVSTSGATNLGGAPGTANDLATGGQGGRQGDGGGGGGGGRQ